ncbi:unnamed protein product [Adineta ricciae]|uniref:RSE1/DDB1/CPSF1 C-terminal domain-containing protein n=1 Tax=Adineta ricciae TaxID=249248 RepID=A0A815WGL5_ADIRI|nr:unnamed protein product [Adineta ricciae]CAF1548568.1 unnamed protein product [Adineta ricciae]
MNFVDNSTSHYIAVGTTIVFEYDNDRQPIGRLILFSCRKVNVKNDFILFSDEIYSITVLRYNPSGHTFEEITTDVSPQPITGCQFIDDDTFVCTETHGNLLCYHKDHESTKELDRKLLTRLEQYHLAEQINIFRHGHFVTQQTSQSTIFLATCSLMAVTSGYIGLVVQLPPSLYRLLASLEKSLAQHIPNVGQIEHSTWRSIRADKQSTISSGFIDGDLIQLYLTY